MQLIIRERKDIMRMQFMRIMVLLAAAVILCVSGFAGAAGVPTIKVGAIFARTGDAVNIGGPEAKTVEMFVEKINKEGGVNGRKIELIMKDSGSNPEKAVLFAKQLIEEDKVLAILGPSTTGETMAIKSICQDSNTILLSCAAAEDIVNPIAGYVFKTPQKDSDAVRRIFQVMKKKGIKKIGVITSNDGFGMAGNKQFDNLAPLAGVTVAISEVYDEHETNLTEVLTRVKKQDVQAVVNWSTVPMQSLVARDMKQIDLNVPLFQSHGFGNIKYVRAGGEVTNGTIFPCGRLLIAEQLAEDNPQKKLLMEYKEDYESRYKEDVSSFGGYAYDAVLILVEGIKKAKSFDGEKVRDAIENIRMLVGTTGVFNFSPWDHNGLDLDSFEVLTVENGNFTVYKY